MGRRQVDGEIPPFAAIIAKELRACGETYDAIARFLNISSTSARDYAFDHAPPKERRPGYVYVMILPWGAVKIGYTKDVGNRRKQHGAKTRVIWVSKWQECAYSAERRLLRIVKSRREELDIDVRDAIAAAKQACS